MVVPSRSDQNQRFKSTRASQPIVLARLPRVGVNQPVQNPSEYQTEDLSTKTQKPNEYVSLRMDGPQTLGKSELEDFAYPYEDSTHQIHDFRSANIPLAEKTDESAHPGYIQETSVKENRRRRRQASPLLKAHSQLAPFAGLIVALALITSAGLLYWIVMGPSQIPSDYYNYPTDGVGQMDFPIPEFKDFAPSMPAVAVEEPTVNVFEDEPLTQQIEESEITPTPETGSVATLARLNTLPPQVNIVQPEIQTAPVESTPTVSVEAEPTQEMLSFPQTESYQPLDFSVLQDEFGN